MIPWLFVVNGTLAQATYDVKANYTKAEYMIPMRDGVKLYTQVYTPKDQTQKYPFLLFRTPYSIPPYGPDNYRARLGPSVEFDQEGFIFVFQDVRGQYRSEGGEFIVMKPHKPNKRGPQDTDESSDTYDTIEWLLAHIPNNNGRAGQWGVSYPGWQTAMGMIEAHPALIASSPQASPADMWIGDDFHHNGAFRYMYTFNWLAGVARVRDPRRDTMNVASRRSFNYGTPDGYKFFMDLGPVVNANARYFKNDLPTWNEYMQHGSYDEYWKKQYVPQYLSNIKHHILNVAGWFDAEDFYGPMAIYRGIEALNPVNQSTLVVGPWRHGGWNSPNGESLGNIHFGSNTSIYFQREVQFPFFNYYLKDKGESKLPEALVFETGSNQWKSYDRWPPRNVEAKNLYLHANGKLSFNPPNERSNDGFDSYVSDPDKPVPFTAETRNTQGFLWMIEDQRFAASRPDVLVYETDELTEDVTIAGPIIASLEVASTGTDADWVVKLIDVYPGNAPDNVPDQPEASAQVQTRARAGARPPNETGVRMGHFQMLLAGEVMRSKFRNSIERPEPMVPNEVTKIEFDVRDRYHRFLKGHRIMVQIQSTWFPVIDRNPQRFMDIYHASEADFQKATQKVFRSATHSSHLKFGVMR